MIKIVKQGKIPTCYEITCVKCHCIFHFEDEDIIEDSFVTSFDHIVCPCCGIQLYLVDGKNEYYYYEEDTNG